jgi:hypothetical protein
MPSIAPTTPLPLPALLEFWHGTPETTGMGEATGYMHAGLVVEICRWTNPTNAVSLFRTLYDTQSQDELPAGAAEYIREGYGLWDQMGKPTHRKHLAAT